MSLIPLLTDVTGRGVQASSKLGHGGLSETIGNKVWHRQNRYLTYTYQKA